jgi:SAM-dependent methyltransferase
LRQLTLGARPGRGRLSGPRRRSFSIHDSSAKARAPLARFQTGSLLTAKLPVCDAVTAIGEIVNYQFDPKHSRAALTRLFRRVHDALRPGGLFVFDVAGPDRVPAQVPGHYWKEGADWSIHVEVDGSARSRWLTRRIVCFRKNAAGRYRRSEEVHRLRLYDSAEVGAELSAIGFRVREQSGYGRFRLYPGLRAVIARKTPYPCGKSVENWCQAPVFHRRRRFGGIGSGR